MSSSAAQGRAGSGDGKAPFWASLALRVRRTHSAQRWWGVEAKLARGATYEIGRLDIDREFLLLEILKRKRQDSACASSDRLSAMGQRELGARGWAGRRAGSGRPTYIP